MPLEEPVTFDELRESFRRIAGDDYGMGEPRWKTRFLSERRQARHYRVGRVFLAGDAAHVHSPVGGQGMNTGIQDAVNLGWKLAATLRGRGSDSLLDSYEAERHPVGESVLKLTDALNKLVLSGSRWGVAWRRLLIRTIIKFGPARRQVAMRLSGLGIHYGPVHRAPDMQTSGGRLYEVLRSGKFVLINAPSEDENVISVDSQEHSGVCLVRPDGYVASSRQSRLLARRERR